MGRWQPRFGTVMSPNPIVGSGAMNAARRALLDDVVPLQVDALQRVFAESLTAVIAKGSVILGDFVPGYSDLDIHAFIEPSRLRSPLVPHPHDALRFQACIGAMSPADFGCSAFEVLMCSADGYPPGWISPPEGTYELVYGSIPTWFVAPTKPECITHGRQHLRGVEPAMDSLLTKVADTSNAELSQVVRSIGAALKPAIYAVAAVLSTDPLGVWQTPRDAVIDALDGDLPFVEPAQRFFHLISRWSRLRDSREIARAAAGAGIAALAEIVEWNRTTWSRHTPGKPPVVHTGVAESARADAVSTPRSLTVETLSLAPTGRTERWLELRPLRAAGSTIAATLAIDSLVVRDVGRGVVALDDLLRRILAGEFPATPGVLERSVAVPIEMELFYREDGAPIRREMDGRENRSRQFLTMQGPERAEHVHHYAERITTGEIPPPPILVTGAFLAHFGAHARDSDLYMLDGARRISAHAVAGVNTLTALVVMPPEHYATLLPSEEVASLQERVDSIPWFGGYQSIPLLGIRGNRTSARFEHMDLELLRGARVMDFGCNIGQASLVAAAAGAAEVIGVDGVKESCACAGEAARLSGFDSLHFCHVNFNAPDFAAQIDAAAPGRVDYSFFFSVYRTKELTQRDRVFEYILDKTCKSVFFEGHSDPRIDSPQYYQWLFESFGLRWEFLGHGEGDRRPLFVLNR